MKIYIGMKDGTWTVFRSETTPNADSHPEYNGCIGPFRTVRGATFMRDYGKNNPHIRCVADAERIAKKEEQCRDITEEMNMWAVQAIRDGKQLPTFYLDPNVQGILNQEHALKIAHEIVGNNANIWVELV